MTAAVDRSPIRVVGRYALYQEIAAGGMATVHVGRLLGPVGFARTVAIKRLHPQFAKDPEFVSMFLDEARLAARVQHPNVVATIDVVATDGELFLIMDYVRGESLSKLVRTVRKQGRTVPPRIAASVICGFLHGLHAAHEAKNERGEPLNLVHRDVSPQNVLVGADGIARVLDFGIAKAAGRIQVTRDGQIKGKLAYMPPEQLAGRELTRAVDIYASAVVMWETLTAERLFKGENEGETLAKILREPVPPPSTVVSTVPRAFDTPLLRALSRDVSKRQATARELALELEKCVGIASPTEVGEWVEDVVGPTLSAREEEIARIESNSATLRQTPSGRPTPSSDSDSDISRLPASRNGTLLGVGAPSSGSLRRHTPSSALGAAMPTAPTKVQGTPTQRSHVDTLTETTGSHETSNVTATMTLPVAQRLPIIAAVAGVGVLAIVMAVVLLGKGSKTDAGPELRQAASASTTPAVSVPLTTIPSAGASASSEPPPAESATAASSAEKPAASQAPSAAPPPQPHVVKPPVVRPPAPPAPPPTNTAKKNCDPPYTVDAQGRRHYKLECM